MNSNSFDRAAAYSRRCRRARRQKQDAFAQRMLLLGTVMFLSAVVACIAIK